MKIKSADFFVHSSSFVDEGVEIGGGTKVWHFCHIQSGARLGEKCSLGQNVNVGPGVLIGDNVRIQNNVSVYEGVELESDVFCGPSVVFTNVIRPRSRYPRRSPQDYRRTLVREGASLGANSTILCGVTIGRHAFIAAGSVVTRDVPDYCLVRGVPARHAGWMCECGGNLSTENDSYACGECGRLYTLHEKKLAPLSERPPEEKKPIKRH